MPTLFARAMRRELRPIVVGEDCRCAIAAVDVQPCAMPRTHRGDRFERIDCAGVHRARTRDHRNRQRTGCNVRGKHRVECIGAHAQRIVRRHDANGCASEAEQLDGLLVARVRLRRLVDEHPYRRTRIGDDVRAIEAHVPADPRRRRMSRDREPGDGGGRAPAHEESHALLRKAEDRLEPLDHLPLDPHRCVITASDARIHCGGERLRVDADRRGRRVHPRGKARVPVAEREGADLALEAFEDRVERFAGRGQGRRQHRCGQRIGHRLEHRLRRQRREIARNPIRYARAGALVLVGAPREFGIGVAVSGRGHEVRAWGAPLRWQRSARAACAASGISGACGDAAIHRNGGSTNACVSPI